jgi:hypothetical protein
MRERERQRDSTIDGLMYWWGVPEWWCLKYQRAGVPAHSVAPVVGRDSLHSYQLLPGVPFCIGDPYLSHTPRWPSNTTEPSRMAKPWTSDPK